jgi:hypothetical protein
VVRRSVVHTPNLASEERKEQRQFAIPAAKIEDGLITDQFQNSAVRTSQQLVQMPKVGEGVVRIPFEIARSDLGFRILYLRSPRWGERQQLADFDVTLDQPSIVANSLHLLGYLVL